MQREIAERVLHLIRQTPGAAAIDITGGAPELNPNFRLLVAESHAAAKHVIDRCNLTVLLEPGVRDLPEFLAANKVEIIASLPCYTRDNVDKQRGRGVFDKSIEVLRLLNGIGYGISAGLVLNLVYNPLGAVLPPPQQALEADYQRRLTEDFGIRFNQLFTITNMPISRFADFLERTGQLESYSKLLYDAFNPATVNQLMCRSLLSVSWDGYLYDCDFNQMLGIPVPGRPTVWDIDSFEALENRRIATAGHCFGCTAGAGSSCGGTLA